MPHEPKRRHSRERKGKRRAGIKLELPHATKCTNCSASIAFHTVCPNCGYYKGVQMIAVKNRQSKAV